MIKVIDTRPKIDKIAVYMSSILFALALFCQGIIKFPEIRKEKNLEPNFVKCKVIDHWVHSEDSIYFIKIEYPDKDGILRIKNGFKVPRETWLDSHMNNEMLFDLSDMDGFHKEGKKAERIKDERMSFSWFFFTIFGWIFFIIGSMIFIYFLGTVINHYYGK